MPPSSALPIVYPPIAWTNQDLVLYHGTIDTFASTIVTGPVISSLGRPNTDFGPGFYTTTLLVQAHMWAAQIAVTRPGTAPAVIELTVSRNALAQLAVLAFVRGDFAAEDYWSFVHYCRMGATDHGRPGFYDLVYGPVAAFWNQRMTIAGADQISFHTLAADAVLNRSARRRII